MGEMDFEVGIDADSEGYIPFECPSCRGEFKLKVNKIQNEDSDAHIVDFLMKLINFIQKR